MKIRIGIAALMFVCMGGKVVAQDYAVLVDFDKKVIKVDSLGLPASFKAAGILSMLPELLERPGESYTQNYDVQIEDMSLGNNADVVLSELQLADIDKIEVSEDPLSTYQNKGQGGSINIILKRKDKGTWGTASVDGSTVKDFSPQFLMNHSSGKFFFRGLVLGELYDTSSTETTTNGSTSSEDKTDRDFSTELARVYMEYKPTTKDLYRLNLSESYSRSKVVASANNLTKTTTLKAFFKYQHTFNAHSNISTEWQYNYVPTKINISEEFMVGGINHYDNKNTQNFVGGKVEYQRNLMEASGKNYADLYLGAMGNFTKTDKSFDPKVELKGVLFLKDANKQFSTIGDTYQFTPYVNFESRFGDIKLKLVAEYQYFDYHVERHGIDIVNVNKKASVHRDDFTGKAMFEWQFRSNQNLRFIFDRKIQRASNEQIYPYQVFDVDEKEEMIGNSKLKPTLSHEFSLDYISNYGWNGQKLTLNAGVSYNLVNDIIRSKLISTDPDNKYITFENFGDNHLWNVDFMALYSYKCFALSMAANLFRNDMHVDVDGDDLKERNHSYYCNISVLPSLHFKSGWMGSLNFIYYSKVKDFNSELGDCLETQAKVGKSFGHWNVHCFGRLALTGKVKNVAGDSVTKCDMFKNNIGIGARYEF